MSAEFLQHVWRESFPSIRIRFAMLIGRKEHAQKGIASGDPFRSQFASNGEQKPTFGFHPPGLTHGRTTRRPPVQ